MSSSARRTSGPRDQRALLAAIEAGWVRRALDGRVWNEPPRNWSAKSVSFNKAQVSAGLLNQLAGNGWVDVETLTLTEEGKKELEGD